ncbi:MAG: ATP-dependent RNA helicase RhlE [Bacteroidetes bacterium ADurb.Bin028]|nr:MAG: ATP-dependent RNA helicase RhlE [Bacteroidetes bacterium ADurb.Bin028]
MHRFRSGNLQLLVATDVAARGLDVNDLSHIINYNLPDEREIYIHRTGRTGRAGKKGEAITIIHNRELHKIREIEKILKKPIHRRQVPDGKEVCTKQLMHIIDRIEHLSEIDPEIDQFLPIILKKLSWLDRDELIKRFVAVEFSRFLTYYKNAYDLNEPDFKENKRSNKAKNEGKSGYTKFFLTLGAKDGLNKGKLLDLINSNDNIAGADIGKIEIMPGYTFFEMDSNYENEVIRAFNNKRYAGKRLKIEIKNSSKKEKPDFRKKDNKSTPKSDKKRQIGRRK